MPKEHRYAISTTWTGNLGSGTADYRGYSRNHEIAAGGKATTIPASSDAGFRGDAARYNPEELLVASLSACHMLWILHLCADAGIVVTGYADDAEGTMRENPDGSGEFVRVLLRPRMTISDPGRIEEARALHHRAHELCFIARSVNFPVDHEPQVEAAAAGGR
ncbi:MAG TPA: OsmC family protein [Bryobacteraceae bacterium]|nr:OsmC family protein [Bryobacteraceae bacterium]